MKKLLLATLALALSQNVFAETLFSCTTSNGKTATLNKSGNQYIYTFGKAGKTEITVKNTANQLLSNRMTGKYMYAYSEDVFTPIVNGQHTYLVHHYWSTRGDEFSKLYVLKNNKKIATLNCKSWEVDFDKTINDKEADRDFISSIGID